MTLAHFVNTHPAKTKNHLRDQLVLLLCMAAAAFGGCDEPGSTPVVGDISVMSSDTTTDADLGAQDEGDAPMAGLDAESLESTTPPTVTISAASLRVAPPLLQLAAYQCPTLSSYPRIFCGVSLGPQPPLDSLNFELEAQLTVTNVHAGPVSLNELLLVLEVGDEESSLCVSCGSGGHVCEAQRGPCENFDAQLGDAPQNNLLSTELPASTQSELEALSAVARGGVVEVDLRLALDVDSVLGVLETVAPTYVDDLLDAKPVSVSIDVGFRAALLVNSQRRPSEAGPRSATWTLE